MDMAKTITLDGNEFQIAFSFDAEILAVVRTLPTRTWDAAAKIWRAPNTPANVAALSELASRFEFALLGAAAEVLHVQANEIDQMLAEAVAAGAATRCDAPDVGYTVRGGGAMLDGTRAYHVFRRNNGDVGFAECDADRSGLSGSGGSGYVTYDVDEDGAYRVIRCSGSIQNHSSSTSYLYVRRGEFYRIGETLAYALLGIDPATVAAARDERRCADADYDDDDDDYGDDEEL